LLISSLTGICLQIWAYYVNEQVITESKAIKDKRGRVKHKKTDPELAAPEDISSRVPTEDNKEPKKIITKFHKQFSIKKARGKQNM